MNFLAADIGATNSRLAWVSGQDVLTSDYPNAGFADLYQVIAQFLQDQGRQSVRIAKMALGLPGPPDAERIRLTNINWVVERSRLREQFNVDEVVLLNDFQAAAVGAISNESPVVLHPAQGPARTGTAVVTGAGTGLGLAWFADTAGGALPLATEGGHADFAPVNAEQYGLHRWLAELYGHVSWERVLSGQGLRDLHRYFAGGAAEAPPADQISRQARENDPVALQVVNCFVDVLGRYAGNLALQFNPAAGIYLCGGVTGHLAPWIERNFCAAYLDKGRMRGQVECIPAFLIREQNVGLRGAVQMARGANNGTA